VASGLKKDFLSVLLIVSIYAGYRELCKLIREFSNFYQQNIHE